MQFFKIFLILGLIGLAPAAYAACTSPAGVVGQFQYIVNSPNGAVFHCDGTNWNPIETSDTAASCTTPGAIRYNSTPTPKRLEFCGGNTVSSTYTWRSGNGDTTGAGGACATNGKFEYDTGISKPRFCEAGTYRIIGGVALLFSPQAPMMTNNTVGPVTTTIDVQNTGGAASSAITVALSGADASWFTISANNCTTLAAGGSCTFDLTFAGNYYGPIDKTATVTISATAGGSTGIAVVDCKGSACSM